MAQSILLSTIIIYFCLEVASLGIELGSYITVKSLLCFFFVEAQRLQDSHIRSPIDTAHGLSSLFVLKEELP